MKKKRLKSMVQGTLLLTGAGALCKVLGMVYRIHLGNLLGTQGMGGYQLAYSVYSMLLMAASGGVSMALSAVVAGQLAGRRPEEAEAYFRTARGLTALLGLAFGIASYALSAALARWVGMPAAEGSLKIAAPAILFAAVSAAYRGYYQGAQDMRPAAASQIVEQVVKMLAGAYFAKRWSLRGTAYGVAGAMFGVSISECVGLLWMRLCGHIPRGTRGGGRRRVGELLRRAVPVTLAAAVFPALGSVDSMLSLAMLARAGYSEAQASALYGLYSGFVLPIVHLPGILSAAVSMNLVPALAAAIANDRKDLQRRQYSFGLKAAGVLGIPAAVLFWSFAEEILCALYPHLVGAELAQATGLFRLMAPCALFVMAAQVTGGMLQGMGRVKRPMVHLCLGAAGKIVLEAALMCDPAVHIRGAAIGSTLCYGVAALWNLTDVLRLGCGEYHFLDCCAKPLACSAAMLAVIRLAYPRLLGGGARWALVGAGTLGAAVYAAGIWLCRAVTRRDFAQSAPETWGRFCLL